MRAMLMVVLALTGCGLYSDDDTEPGADAAAAICEAPPPCRSVWGDECPAEFCVLTVVGQGGETTTCAIARGDDGCM